MLLCVGSHLFVGTDNSLDIEIDVHYILVI